MDIIESLSKILPMGEIYKDTAQPAFKEIGEALGKSVKAARFVIAPLEYLAAQHDRWEKYLIKVSERVDEANLVKSHPSLAIPILEGLSYSDEDSILTEMFINLLAKSIDKTKLDKAHPAFPKIIQQLSPDEALILVKLKLKPYKITEQSDYVGEENVFRNRRTIFDGFPTHALVFPHHIELYMNHLNALNLAGTYQEGNQEIIKDKKTKKQTGVYIHSYRRLTKFGDLFCQACVPDSWDKEK